jgi:hypothetical protein
MSDKELMEKVFKITMFAMKQIDDFVEKYF